MRVLVTDGDSRAALAVVRSLGARGHTVHVASEHRRCLAGASKMASEEHWAPDPSHDPTAWVAAIDRMLERLHIDLLVPITEVAFGNVYGYERDRVWPVVCPSRERYEDAVDKYLLLERGRAHGLSCPRGILIEEPKHLDSLPDGFRYPVVLKARRSRQRIAGRWVQGSAHTVRNESELREAIRHESMAGGVVLQEFLPGHGEGIFLLAQDGHTLASFAHRRLREKPPTGGTSVLRESIVPDPALLEHCVRLLESLRWSGVAMLEFRRTPSGEAALMELNPRFWGSLQLAIDSGVDFPSMLADLHAGRAVEPVEARVGVRSRWLLGDLDHLLLSLRSPKMRDEVGTSIPRLLGDFLWSFVDGSRLEVWRAGDPLPFWRELQAWVRALRTG